MKKIKPWLLLALVFLVGVIFGVVGTRLVVRRVVHEAILHPERVQIFVERRLTRRLNLNSDQQVKLDQILNNTRGQMQAIRQQYRPAMAQVFSNANQQISVMLTTEQLARYDKIKAENAVFLRGAQLTP